MAKLLGKKGRKTKFNTKGKDGKKTNSLIPAGEKLLVEVEQSDYVQNRNGDGHIAKFTIGVIKGDYKGRKVFLNLNLDHPNEKAVEMAEAEFVSLIRSCKLTAVEDTEELHNIPFMIEVGIQASTNKQYDDQNNIRKYWAVEKKSAKRNTENKSKGKKSRKGKGKKGKPSVSFD